jgi:glycosyltransferase involved in cell wall biosynthesis
VRRSNAQYRAIEPLNAMLRRGHEVVWPPSEEGEADLRRLTTCDLVHVYRRSDPATQRVLSELARRGTAITFDNDDDFTTISKQSPSYRTSGGVGGQRHFAATVKVAGMAHCLTTTNEVLAEKYRHAGVERVEVIPNCLEPDVARPRRRHDGVVIGWVAGTEHYADAARIGIADALRRLLAAHEHVRVECVGVNLALPERYRHDRVVPFRELPGRVGGFDVGIAPLADIPFNWARSDIKVKEYAASGVPWLASPVGPYLGLGEGQGGRLVPDDGWLDALERLVTSRRERQRLARNAAKWAKGQTIDAVADRWERVFATAAGGA